MTTSNIFFASIALVIIFLFAIQKFGHQMQRVAGKQLKAILHAWTDRPSKAIAAGALVSSIIPSSMAVTLMLVDMVSAGIIASANAIGVVIGANLGIIIISQFIALDMTYIAPIIVIIGFLVAHTHSRFKKYGKAVFYFGVIFFSLFMISILIEPLKNNADFIGFIQSVTNPYQAVFVGAALTAIIQSGALFSGLVLIFAKSNLLSLPVSLGLLLGAFITPPLTAVIASSSASADAKRVAVANAIFNIFGAIIFVPLITAIIPLLKLISVGEVQEIVNAQFIWNASCALICFVFFKAFNRFVTKATAVLYSK